MYKSVSLIKCHGLQETQINYLCRFDESALAPRSPEVSRSQNRNRGELFAENFFCGGDGGEAVGEKLEIRKSGKTSHWERGAFSV